MKRILLLALLLPAALAHADLSSDVRHILADPSLARARHSVKLVELSADQASVLFESDARQPLEPASNLKLVTTSAAIARLGADFKFRTLLLSHGGDLILIGDGDPSFGDAALLKKSGWDVDTVFHTWAAALARRGFRSFRRLLVDDSVFDQQFIHPHWPADQTEKHYEAEVAGMDLNANLLDVYVKPSGTGELVRYITDPHTSYFTIRNSCVSGPDNRIWLSRQAQTNDLLLRGEAADSNDVPVSITVHDPPLYAATVLAECLQFSGITVGPIARDRTCRRQLQSDPSGWTALAVNETPLTTVMSNANKNSVNLYAECVCKRLGFAAYGEGSWPNGVRAVGDFLTQIGVPDDQYHLDDGCGLSKENAISADLMTTVLAHDFYSPSAKAFMDTMAIAAVDGTMEDRFRGSDLRGRVLAKSGYVNGVSCLSGYLHARNGQWYGFSILLNDVPSGGLSSAKNVEERIVHALDVDTAVRR